MCLFASKMSPCGVIRNIQFIWVRVTYCGGLCTLELFYKLLRHFMSDWDHLRSSIKYFIELYCGRYMQLIWMKYFYRKGLGKCGKSYSLYVFRRKIVRSFDSDGLFSNKMHQNLTYSRSVVFQYKTLELNIILRTDKNIPLTAHNVVYTI